MGPMALPQSPAFLLNQVCILLLRSGIIRYVKFITMTTIDFLRANRSMTQLRKVENSYAVEAK
jgi:hypothetical protein